MASNLHDGHRKRLREKAEKFGMDALEDHEVIELLLFYALPRVNTNEIAHRLMKRFGRLDRVLEADKDALMEVEGVGENAAYLLRLFPQVFRRYALAKQATTVALTNSAAYGEYMMPYFIGKREENVYLLLLDAELRTLSCEHISSGTGMSVVADIPKIISCAQRERAAAAVIAHNHPNGVALPSSADIELSRKLQKSLATVKVKLLDHIIVAGPVGDGTEPKYADFVSMADSGIFRML
ncbi:MAG: hypothetical protein IKM04_06615 [Clostridia bacterium]|nr:hypothetical protein [Clostridia bacterium]